MEVISNKMRPILAQFISKEQFGFLKNHQILEVVGISQEFMHTIKVKKLDAIILKMDLIKAFDRVNWVFLRLILLQKGLDLGTFN